MYEKFYNLKQQPFHITPDLRFLYLSETHKQALGAMIYVIKAQQGFMAITGGIGVGKTTVVRAFLDKAASADLKVIYIFHANLSFTDLVKTIYRELGLKLSTNDLIEMVDGLYSALIELHGEGKTVVLVIDEAQNTPVETLENLRMLSNLETSTEKLIQVVLVGQTELEDLLERHELRQLKQRIVVRSRIAPLSAQESHAYIAHRLLVAGLDNPTIFSKGALDIIVKEANGVPRRLNVLCNNALVIGFRSGMNPVTASIARQVVTNFAAKQMRPTVRTWKVAAVAGLVLFIALIFAFSMSPYGHRIVQKLGGGLGQKTEPGSGRVPVSSPSGERQGVDPDRGMAPPSEPRGGATEPRAAGKQESVIPSKDTGGQNPGNPGASSITRVVKRGETLSDLIREVYGISAKSALDSSLINLVKQHNPAIVDPNLIQAGSVIRFPELSSEQHQNR